MKKPIASQRTSKSASKLAHSKRWRATQATAFKAWRSGINHTLNTHTSAAATVHRPVVRLALILPRQSEAVVGVSRACLRLAPAPGGNDYKLASVDFIGCRGRVAAGLELEFPEQLAGRLVVSVEALVHGGANENQSSRRDEWSADVKRAGSGKALGLERGIGPQRRLPSNLAPVQVNGREGSPGTPVHRKAVRVAKFVMPGRNEGNLLSPAQLGIVHWNLRPADF